MRSDTFTVDNRFSRVLVTFLVLLSILFVLVALYISGVLIPYRLSMFSNTGGIWATYDQPTWLLCSGRAQLLVLIIGNNFNTTNVEIMSQDKKYAKQVG